MKKLFIVILTLTFLPNVYAADIEAPGPMRKLQRGFLNIALSPIEIEHHLAEENKEESFPGSWLYGVGKGTFATAGRILTGAYEILTFPVAVPAEYKPIVLPEFTWEYLNGGESKVESRK